MDMSPKRFSICLDSRHIGAAKSKSWSNYDVVGAVRQLKKDLTHVHLWDNIGYNILVSPGKGETDFAAFAEALIDIGYNGVSVIEGEYFRWDIADIEKELMDCKHYLGTCGFGAFWDGQSHRFRPRTTS
jgi:sugar phosphate isomerase/epimerase